MFKPGKLPKRYDSRNLRLSKYLKAGLPAPPRAADWATKVPTWPMYLNDQLGDCVLASAGHMIEQWTFYAGKSLLPSDQQILTAYEAVGGYVPGDPTTDKGTVMLDALNYWRGTGVAGRNIHAYVEVNTKSLTEVKQAIQLFGNCYVGLQLPVSAQGQDFWSVPSGGLVGSGAPGSWGGHCVPLVAFGPSTLCCVTWGKLLRMSHSFFLDYCDEAYAVISNDWIEANGASPGGIHLAALEADLQAL
jgi:hypothetical protein